MSDTSYPDRWTLVYAHSYGRDETDYLTYEDAWKGACEIIVKYWDEVDDAKVQKALRVLLLAKDWRAVVDLWSKYQEAREEEGDTWESLRIEARPEPLGDSGDPTPPTCDARVKYDIAGESVCEECFTDDDGEISPTGLSGETYSCVRCADECEVP